MAYCLQEKQQKEICQPYMIKTGMKTRAFLQCGGAHLFYRFWCS